MRLLYLQFQIFQIVLGKLIEIIPIENELERNFYIAETINQNWSYRKLAEQRNRGLFYQLATAKRPEETISLSHQGLETSLPKDIVKDTYFLG